MKNLLYTMLLLPFLSLYAQDIEKMDKKELRLAYQEQKLKNNKTKDSLNFKLSEMTSNNTIQALEINNIKKTLSEAQKKLTENDNRIAELQKLISSQEEKIKILSVVPLKLNPFSKIPEEFKKACSMTYSESKTLYQSKKFILFENKDLNKCLIYLDEKPLYVDFKETIEGKDDDLISVYSNGNVTIKISNQESIGGTETIQIYKALITVHDKEGQEINIKVYGEGGC